VSAYHYHPPSDTIIWKSLTRLKDGALVRGDKVPTRRRTLRPSKTLLPNYQYMVLFVKADGSWIVGHVITISDAQVKLQSVLLIRIGINRIRMFLGLLDPDRDPIVRGTDTAPDPCIIKQKL
jgi:hypothetical protein